MAKVIQKGRAVYLNSSVVILCYKAKNDITSGGVVFFCFKENYNDYVNFAALFVLHFLFQQSCVAQHLFTR